MTAWEIASFGNLPYPLLTNAEVVAHVHGGHSLGGPRAFPPSVWEVLARTLAHLPADRPTFAAVAADLDGARLALPTGSCSPSSRLAAPAPFFE